MEFGENAIFGPKTFIFDHCRGGGKSVVLNYKVFDQVKQVPKNERVLSNSGGIQRGFADFGGSKKFKLCYFRPFYGLEVNWLNERVKLGQLNQNIMSIQINVGQSPQICTVRDGVT